jgi:hypothetical protein
LALASCSGEGGDGGSGDAGLESQRIRSENAAVLRRSDTLLAAGFLVAGRSPAGTVTPSAHPAFDGIASRCRGGTCVVSLRPSGRPVVVALSGLGPFDTYEPRQPRNGIRVYHGTASATRPPNRVDALGFGAWLGHSAFSVNALDHSALRGDQGYVATGVSFQALSYGNDSGSRPAGGAASWTGAMEGVKSVRGATEFQTVGGDARVTVDLSGAVAGVAFTNVFNRVTDGREPPMRWTGMAIGDDGAFSAPEDTSGRTTLVGTFYGPGHQEVGGVFERAGIAGAFGAVRGD